MKKFLALALFCLPAFGQAAYSGPGFHSGSAGFFAAGSSCAMPTPCTYDGLDLIPPGTPPNVGGALNNYATIYDTSYLGHGMANGVNTFGDATKLSPVTRLTDTISKAVGGSNDVFNAGQGGAGNARLTNTDTTLVGIGSVGGGSQQICRFNPTGTNKGFCSSNSLAGSPAWYYNKTSGGTFPPSDSSLLFITEGQNSTGSCNSNCVITDFGSISFDALNRNLLYTFGNSSDIQTATTVTPVNINPSTGQYTVGSPIVDFLYGMPVGANAPAWAASTSYAYGAYVTHQLTASEMATGGAWTLGHTYVLGDVLTNAGNPANCLYKLVTAAGAPVTGSVPVFLTSSCDTNTLTDAVGNVWRGTYSTAQFVYQNTGTSGTSGSAFQWLATPVTLATNGAMASGSPVLTSASNPFTAAMVGQTVTVSGAGNTGGTAPLYTTILSYQNTGQVTLAVATVQSGGTSGATVSLTGHPDVMSATVGDSNGIIWTNVGTSYVPAKNQLWRAIGDVSKDNNYTVSGNPAGSSFASKYGMGISTNTYGTAPSYPGATAYSAYSAGQDTGFWMLQYDATVNVYHLLNTATGIWTDWTCVGGSGYNCSGGTWQGTTIGTLLAITDPFATGQACPGKVHDFKMSKNGLFITNVVSVTPIYATCKTLNPFQTWQPSTVAQPFDSLKSLQLSVGGLSHWALGTNKLVTENNSMWGYQAGVFFGIYDPTNMNGAYGSLPGRFSPDVGHAPPFSFYLLPLNGLNTPQNVPQPTGQPTACYNDNAGVLKNPDCDLSKVFGSHVSWVGDPGTDTWPFCGTTYNLVPSNGFPANAMQNEETCFSSSPTYPAGYVPATSGGPPSGCTPTSAGACGSLTPLAASSGHAWRFTHTFATEASLTFDAQFQISQYSQDANWMFFTSDWDCQLGSTLTGNTGPAVWTSGTYYQTLIVAPVPANPNSLCGLPWQSAASYVAGNTINPIEGTTGSAGIDDVFQAITSGTTGPNSSLTSKQPQCGSVSCFAITNPPSTTTVSVTGATESATTGTFTIATAIELSDGALVTLAGFTPSGWNGTFAVTGTVGAGCPGGATCTPITTFQLVGLPSGLGAVTVFGTAASQGDTVCDFTAGSGDFINPSLPYSSSCSPGVVWQDLGEQTQRGDVFAVNLSNQH